ncbi:ER-phagy receptor 1 [Impatiens glandulifera]|uniref:ER-phagy receptor 1 n=1 Tax=Impatiens glandulifera TaxID=253017 RepID=UPI001FB19492|nr:ER-phagy receptor 1 [Impatiens glandulifera]
MECNKQEAIRAKEIAEKKMQLKDYSSAHKFALKAQVLYPDLENISQIITVCEVHCSSEKNIFGNEKDWYSILKIEHTADETSIKKQYKKLALLLHPDKNNFAGATDAFKLIGEAQRVLLDSEKRKSHDFKHRASRSFVPIRPQHQHPNNNSNAAASMNRTNANVSFSQGQQQTTSSVFKETFWTACPFCCIRYQYYKDLVNRLLQCQQCKKSFTALEVKGRTAPSEANQTRMSDYLKKENTSNPKTEAANSKVQPKRKNVSQNGTTSSQTKSSKAKKPVGSPKKEDKAAGKSKTESSGTTESESSADSVETLEDDLSKQNVEDDPLSRRRSSRSKSNISYKVDISDDDDDYEGGPRKKMKQQPQPEEDGSHPIENLSSEESQQSKKSVDSEENASQTVKEDNDGKDSTETSSDEMEDPQVYTCPDPEFNDFDSIRKEDCFAVGQLWACYDDVDAMPRFYCRIAKVISPGFKVRIMWLEPDSSHDEGNPGNDELPVSCGMFKRGNYEFTEELFMFSHLIHIEKGSRSDRYKVYPRKGETWALFKNWEPNTIVTGNKFEYEFVEVLSDYDRESGVSVAPLEKVQGFTCLFNRTTTTNEGSNSFQVVPSELYRFSHMVPSFKMNGTEREDVPNGSFELDPASLSTTREEDVS